MSERFLHLFSMGQSDPDPMYHSVYFVKTTPPHKVYPHLFLCFFVDSSNKVAEKIASLFNFFSSKHAPTWALYFSKEPGGRALWSIWGTGN